LMRSFISSRRMETNARFLWSLPSAHIGEDMCGVTRKFIFYEMVCNRELNSCQQYETATLFSQQNFSSVSL
jgi:hypothetical protein